uniref:Uncharacterized protein n=1 Tax=Arundo donax TaxID=35708 RepID=A0A0A9BZ27_ARUDO
MELQFNTQQLWFLFLNYELSS